MMQHTLMKLFLRNLFLWTDSTSARDTQNILLVLHFPFSIHMLYILKMCYGVSRNTPCSQIFLWHIDMYVINNQIQGKIMAQILQQRKFIPLQVSSGQLHLKVTWETTNNWPALQSVMWRNFSLPHLQHLKQEITEGPLQGPNTLSSVQHSTEINNGQQFIWPAHTSDNYQQNPDQHNTPRGREIAKRFSAKENQERTRCSLAWLT